MQHNGVNIICKILRLLVKNERGARENGINGENVLKSNLIGLGPIFKHFSPGVGLPVALTL